MLHPSRGLVPFGAVVDWDEARLSVGDAVLVEAHTLRIGEDRVFSLEGDGRDLSVCRVPVSSTALASGIRELMLPERTRSLLNRGAGGDLVIAAAGLRLEALLDAIWGSEGLSAACWDERIGVLSGLGPGSTPTGDDLLTGLAAVGHRLAGRGLVPSAGWNCLLAALERAPRDRTTQTAAEMLAHASRGYFPEVLLDFVMLLGDEQTIPPALQRAADRLTSLGAQTGFDMLAGALAMASRASNRHGETS